MRESFDHEEVEGEQCGDSSEEREEKRPIVERIENGVGEQRKPQKWGAV
jgi:hypothetical protein